MNRKNIKRTLFSAITVLALSAFTLISGPWKNDPAHSQLGFTVTHLGISDVSGTFNDFEVVANASKPDFSDATFELSAKAASIDTRVKMRNDHLKSADFFDAEKYPTEPGLQYPEHQFSLSIYSPQYCRAGLWHLLLLFSCFYIKIRLSVNSERTRPTHGSLPHR